ncbi:MAG: (d)CMP kinase [Desulfovermiculus sp.]
MPKIRPLIITLDGPAGVGKSTVAQNLAHFLRLAYLDTGAMFRAVALHLGEGSWTWPQKTLQSALNAIDFHFAGQGPAAQLTINNQHIGQEIRSEEIGLWASHLGQRPEVRDSLKRAQQEIGRKTSLVAEGRDMGSVVFPDARWKFFLDATPEERARRRWLQLKAMGHNADLGTLTRDLRRRDEQDRNRSEAPLRPAPDAYVVDTTHLNLQQVEDKLRKLIQETHGPSESGS